MGCIDETKEENEYTPQFPNDFQWVNITAGTFMMGAPVGYGRDYEHPQHQVTLTKNFQILIYEVTQSQWGKVMGDNPSGYKWADNHPVEGISWVMCQDFIGTLNELDSNFTYRLPTEAEWEYCCRAGTDTNYSFGDDESKLHEYAWRNEFSGWGNHHPVGQKKPNPWGLYDMHGNVGELCQDFFQRNYYHSSPAIDPQGPETSSTKVLRGGDSLLIQSDMLYSYSRGSLPIDETASYAGIRLVRTEK